VYSLIIYSHNLVKVHKTVVYLYNCYLFGCRFNEYGQQHTTLLHFQFDISSKTIEIRAVQSPECIV
jgi:hypothetical protein